MINTTRVINFNLSKMSNYGDLHVAISNSEKEQLIKELESLRKTNYSQLPEKLGQLLDLLSENPHFKI